MTAGMPRLRPAVHREALPRPLRRGSALRPRAQTQAARSVSLRRLWVFRASSQPMAAVRGGVSLPLPAHLIRPGRWRGMCGIARSCWRRWLGLTPRMRLRLTCQCPIGKRRFRAICVVSASASPRSTGSIICPLKSMRSGNRASRG